MDDVLRFPEVPLNEVFGERLNFVSYYESEKNAVWVSKAALFERYVVSLELPIDIEKRRGAVVRYGGPIFSIVEVDGISRADGKIRYSNHQMRFGAEQWKQLRLNNMDFSVIGYPLKTKEPVRYFKEFWKEG